MESDNSKPPSQQPSKVLQTIKAVAGMVGGVLGYVLGSQALVYIVYPAIFGVLAGALLFWLVPKKYAPIVAACALQIGHGLWMLLGMVVIYFFQPEGVAPLNPFDLFDVLILVLVPLWLAFQPGWIPCLILAIYQVFGIAVNGTALSAQPAGGPLITAILVHLFLRTAALVAMTIGFYEVRQSLVGTRDDVEEIDEYEEGDGNEEQDEVDENPYRPRKS